MSEKTIKQPMVVTTAPERIYLQIADDCYYEDQPFPEEHSDQITWCADSVESCEVPYIREDLAAYKAQMVDVEAIREVLHILRKAGRYDIYDTDQQACDLADKLADALPKDQ